uniref:Uncharacterized protein n=1 Tax=Sphaerodactylus townsendi TaxID=933632 RepID=A0ACB8F642_9SAUR
MDPLEDGRKLKGAIQRSTETGLAVEMPSRTIRQASHESIEDSMNSYGSEGNLDLDNGGSNDDDNDERGIFRDRYSDTLLLRLT